MNTKPHTLKKYLCFYKQFTFKFKIILAKLERFRSLVCLDNLVLIFYQS